MTTERQEHSSETSDHEPTLHDVLEVLAVTNQKIDGVQDGVLTLNNRVDLVEVRMSGIERTVELLKGSVADVHDDLTSALSSFDSDSLKLLDHEKRIRRLEKSTV